MENEKFAVIKPCLLPKLRVQIPFERTFTEAEYSRLKQGFVAESMEDRWHILFKDSWLTFVRQLDGILRLQGSAGEGRRGVPDCRGLGQPRRSFLIANSNSIAPSMVWQNSTALDSEHILKSAGIAAEL